MDNLAKRPWHFIYYSFQLFFELFEKCILDILSNRSFFRVV